MFLGVEDLVDFYGDGHFIVDWIVVKEIVLEGCTVLSGFIESEIEVTVGAY